MQFNLSANLKKLFGGQPQPTPVVVAPPPTTAQDLIDQLAEMGIPVAPVDDLETIMTLLSTDGIKSAAQARAEAAEQSLVATQAYKKVAHYRAKLNEFLKIALDAEKTAKGLLACAARLDAALNPVPPVDPKEPPAEQPESA